PCPPLFLGYFVHVPKQFCGFTRMHRGCVQLSCQSGCVSSLRSVLRHRSISRLTCGCGRRPEATAHAEHAPSGGGALLLWPTLASCSELGPGCPADLPTAERPCAFG